MYIIDNETSELDSEEKFELMRREATYIRFIIMMQYIVYFSNRNSSRTFQAWQFLGTWPLEQLALQRSFRFSRWQLCLYGSPWPEKMTISIETSGGTSIFFEPGRWILYGWIGCILNHHHGSGMHEKNPKKPIELWIWEEEFLSPARRGPLPGCVCEKKPAVGRLGVPINKNWLVLVVTSQHPERVYTLGCPPTQ